jgi:hypothetical protein
MTALSSARPSQRLAHWYQHNPSLTLWATPLWILSLLIRMEFALAGFIFPQVFIDRSLM